MTKTKRYLVGGRIAAAGAEDDMPKRQVRSAKTFRSASQELPTASGGSKVPVSVTKTDTAYGKTNLPKTQGSREVSVRAAKGAGSGAGRALISGAGRALARAFPVAVGALSPSELGNSSLSNKESEEAVKRGAYKQEASIPDKINAEPKAEAAPKAKKPVAVVKKSTTTVVKPKPSSGPSEGARARAALKEFRDWNASREPLDMGGEDENAYTKSVAGEESDGYKKGGMTKRRPPKPAKKAPAKRFASGGSTGRSSASKRGDGCATKGHTKGKYC